MNPYPTVLSFPSLPPTPICCCSSLVAIKQARSPADLVYKGEPLGIQDREEKGAKRTWRRGMSPISNRVYRFTPFPEGGP